jgi:nucleoside-diphosphate-sugar epimerase
MKALVTGGSGFIGSHLVEALLEKGYDVSCLVRRSSNLQWIEGLDVRLVNGSYTDNDSLVQAVRDMDYVFHVGAVLDAPDFDTFYRGNVENTVHLLDACVQVNPGLKKFVFLSSIAAAGPAAKGKPLKESDECHPFSLYGKSKLMAEEAVAHYFDRLPIVILRPTNILGPRQKELLSIIKMLKKHIMPLLGNGDKQTGICFVQDLVRAIILAAEKPGAAGRTFFVSSEEAYSWREMLDFIREELGLAFVVKIPYPLLMAAGYLSKMIAGLTGTVPAVNPASIRSARINYWLHDVGLIKKELGFAARITFEQGMRDTIRWYEEHGLL